MHHAAKAMAMTVIDLYQSPETRQRIREEFEASSADVTYESYIPPGPPPSPQEL
jgi:aminobenzoyl-glutamate utilization protein B